VFAKLAKEFWPGPLTIVLKANLDLIPTMITANTGYVGVRMPNHPIAIELITLSGLPIAAPSANKFGHVSPTKASHVLTDFALNDVTIIDGGPTSVGIESTVAKLIETEAGVTIYILRRGGVSQ